MSEIAACGLPITRRERLLRDYIKEMSSIGHRRGAGDDPGDSVEDSLGWLRATNLDVR